MNGLPSDALSRLAAVAGDTFYSRRISAEDETDRQDVTALNTQHYSRPQFRDSAPGGDLSGNRVVNEETLAIPTGPAFDSAPIYDHWDKAAKRLMTSLWKCS